MTLTVNCGAGQYGLGVTVVGALPGSGVGRVARGGVSLAMLGGVVGLLERGDEEGSGEGSVVSTAGCAGEAGVCCVVT